LTAKTLVARRHLCRHEQTSLGFDADDDTLGLVVLAQVLGDHGVQLIHANE
jgi:hypothetical protein